MEMKKILQHGRIWIIASVISFGSLLFLQIDSSDLSSRQKMSQVQNELAEEQIEESNFFNLDLIKGITQFVIDITKLNF
jgi:hypothetical protein